MKRVCKNCQYYWVTECQVLDQPIFIKNPNTCTCEHFKGEQGKTWGGARPGAGRKPADPDDKRVQMVITIDQETKDRLQAISKARKIRIGRLIDEMVKGEW